MPAKHRPAVRTRATVYRTYRLPSQVRTAMAAKRKQLGITVAAFLAQAIGDELPRIVADLDKVGLPAADSKDRPARLPMTDELLGVLKSASNTTGVPASRILVACVNRAAQRKRRRSKGA